MSSEAFREELLSTLQSSEQFEWMPDLLPRPDGIRFAQGILLGIVLSWPAWLLTWWVITARI
jgi:hypothetical protein